MPTSTAVKKAAATKKAPRPRVPSFVSDFTQWLDVRKNKDTLAERQDTLRDRLMDYIDANGEEDDRGSLYVDLPEAVTHTVQVKGRDGKSKTKRFVYTALKRQLSLRPASPTPDPDKAEQLLRDKGLWLTEAQEEVIRNLQTVCPNVTIQVEVDVDAVSTLYLKKVISEKEYDSTLVEQKEVWSFIPCEEG